MLVTRDHQPPRSLRTRLGIGAQVAIRSWVPRSLVPVIVAVRSWIGRRRPGRLEVARESMRFVVGPETNEAEIERLGLAYLRRATWRMEARWRPSLVNAQEVVGIERLEEAVALGRGVLLSFIHHGDYIGSLPSIARTGHPVVTVGASRLFEPDAPLWQHQHLRCFTSVDGSDGIDVSNGSAGIRELFAQKLNVGIALDFPGHTPTHMFGHDLLLSSGGVRIAYGLDVPIVPVLSEKIAEGPVDGARVVLGEVLRPQDYATPESLHAELARQFEKSIQAWPESTEEPLRMAKSHLARNPTEYRTLS